MIVKITQVARGIFSLVMILHRKVEQVAEEADSIKDSLDKYLLRHQRRRQEAQERAELLGRAVRIRFCLLHFFMVIGQV